MQVLGYYYHANVYCETCGEKKPDVDPEGNDKHAALPLQDEAGARQYCGECNVALEIDFYRCDYADEPKSGHTADDCEGGDVCEWEPPKRERLAAAR